MGRGGKAFSRSNNISKGKQVWVRVPGRERNGEKCVLTYGGVRFKRCSWSSADEG